GVAHEINNPNSITLLNIPMLTRAWLSVAPILEEYYLENGDFLVGGIEYREMREQVPRLFKEVKESAKRIRHIVSDLKDYARKDTTLLMDSVNLNEVADESCRLADNLIKKSTTHFRTDFAPELPLIKGNKQRLKQVIINLLQNSCEALEDSSGGLALSTFCNEKEKTVSITVYDQGTGIPKDKIDKITDPFFTTKRPLGGTGLGLSVSASIVKEHNGILTFESEPGKGTKATVTFPAIV
ncbi:MAG: HAMP domain-containing histidine kinase, partial [Desulfobulbaceae bacterium]|nr:HAMP domain-containing histidine kinase [Desulfobulbaceae bacterium]